MKETTIGLLLAFGLLVCDCNGGHARPDAADAEDGDEDADVDDGADLDLDGESEPYCGNGVVDPGEDCDGNCPESCDDDDPCTIDSGTVSPELCSIDCQYAPITACTPGDGCCPEGCDRTIDSDCPFYVDATGGNDENDGLTPETAWQTAARVSEEPLAPGDRVAFKRGEVWHETLRLTASGSEELPIVIETYGEADDPPFFVPTQPVTGWTAESDGIYSAALDVDPLLVMADGERLTVAHHPNAGYLYVDEDSAALDSFTDSDLASSASGDVVGAMVLMRANRWNLLTRRVASFSAPTVTMEGPLGGEPSIRENVGYVLTDKLWMLDSPGEWFYDAASGRLHVRLTGDADPSGHAIEIATESSGIELDRAEHVELDGLGVRLAGLSGIDLRGPNGIRVRNCLIESVGYHGIFVNWPPADAVVRIEDNTITGSNFSGVMVNANTEEAQQVTLHGNSVEDTAERWPLVGRTSPAATYGWGFGMGLHMRGWGVVVEENTVLSSAYSCMVAGGTDLDILHNHLERCCLLFDDGGGIYMGGSGHEVRGNTIIDSLGNAEGTPSFFTTGSTAAQGIYPDDRSHDIVMEDNTVLNADLCFQLHNTHSDQVRGNTVYGCRRTGIYISEDSIVDIPGFVHDNVVENNIVFVTGDTYAVSEYYRLDYTVDFASYDSNTYWHEEGGVPFIRSTRSGGGEEYSFDEWRAATGFDAGSVNLAPVYQVVPTAGRPTGPSNLIANGAFDSDVSGWGSWPSAVDVAWNADCGLTGGCLSATAVGAGSGALVSSPSFSITSGRGYLLRLSLRADELQTIGAIVRHNADPWESLGMSKTIGFGPERTDYSLAFTATGTQTGRLDLTSSDDFAFYLDDVDLREAEVLVNDRTDDVRILTNWTAAAVSVDLEGETYCDLDDNEVSGTVTVPAWSSRILLACRCNNDGVCNNHETAAFCALDCG